MLPSRQITAIAKRQLALRDQLWPEQQYFLWNRRENKGFATIPKTLPLVLSIMDDMTKGAPISSTYLALWCATWDNSYVPITKPTEMSIIAGFGGQRGEHTWAGRMKKLQELHFISIKPGKSGPMSHVVIWNPHTIIRYHHDVAKTPGLTEASFTGLLERAMEIGADDMLAPMFGMSPSPEGPIPTLAAKARTEREAAAQQAANLAAATAAAASASAAFAFPVPPMPAAAAPPPPLPPLPMVALAPPPASEQTPLTSQGTATIDPIQPAAEAPKGS